jgi:Flp pilus assembly protein TadD
VLPKTNTGVLVSLPQHKRRPAPVPQVLTGHERHLETIAMNNLGRKALTFVIVMAAVGAVAWFGRKAYKSVAERHLVAHANQFVAKKDYKNAVLCLQHALQMDPLNGKASRVMADILETVGSPAALSWRAHAAKYDSGNPTNRLLWAETAIKLRDLKSATEALDGVSEGSKKTAQYHKLVGALAWEKGKNAEAESQYAEALRLEPTNLAMVMNLATIHLASTNSDISATGRLSLEQLATNTTWRLMALRYLVADALAHKSVPDAVRYSTQIVSDPAAPFGDKIDHLQLLQVAQTDGFAPWLESLKQAATNSPAQLYALARWMFKSEGPTNTLQWVQLQPHLLLTNLPVHLIITDCQIALQDWEGLLRSVEKRDWGADNFYRLALEAKAQRELKNDYGFETSWRKAMRESNQHADRLARLAQLSGIWGWRPQRTDALREFNSQFPKDKWALAQLMDQLYTDGNSQELKDVLSRTCANDPSDVRLKNALANVSLLRKADLDKACRLAREAYDILPNDPFVISTYSYSLLLQNKLDEATKVAGSLKPEALKDPVIAGIFGVVQAQAGHKDLAKEPLERAESGALLPEEKEMVHVAKAGL